MISRVRDYRVDQIIAYPCINVADAYNRCALFNIDICFLNYQRHQYTTFWFQILSSKWTEKERSGITQEKKVIWGDACLISFEGPRVRSYHGPNVSWLNLFKMLISNICIRIDFEIITYLDVRIFYISGNGFKNNPKSSYTFSKQKYVLFVTGGTIVFKLLKYWFFEKLYVLFIINIKCFL